MAHSSATIPGRGSSEIGEGAAPRWGRVVTLVVGDLIALLFFVVNGRATHGEVETVGQVARTALPFVLAWFIVAPFAGAFGRAGSAATTATRRLLPRTALAWIVALPVALVLRVAFGSTITLAFAVVALLVNAVLLLLWRGALSLLVWRGTAR